MTACRSEEHAVPVKGPAGPSAIAIGDSCGMRGHRHIAHEPSKMEWEQPSSSGAKETCMCLETKRFPTMLLLLQGEWAEEQGTALGTTVGYQRAHGASYRHMPLLLSLSS